METSDITVESILGQFLASPFGIMFILGVIVNLALIVAFFVMAYNVSQIRQDIREWLDLEHPEVEVERAPQKK